MTSEDLREEISVELENIEIIIKEIRYFTEE